MLEMFKDLSVSWWGWGQQQRPRSAWHGAASDSRWAWRPGARFQGDT